MQFKKGDALSLPKGDPLLHPQEILDEMKALEEESAEILNSILELI